MKTTIKNLLIILIFFFVWNNLLAQNSRILIPLDRYKFDIMSIDSGTIRIYYALNALDINDSKTYDDLQRLDIGRNLSKYYSSFYFNSDSLKRDFMKKNPKAQGIPTWPGERGKIGSRWSILMFSEFYKDFSKKTLTEYANMPVGIPHSQYTEEIPVQDWQLQDDTLTVCGYLCQKATCRFRGNDFTAWFAPELPISNGPWKFGGLPGLILKIQDSGEHYIFECIKIESHAKKNPIIMFDEKRYQKIERIKLRQLEKEIHANYYKFTALTTDDGIPFKFIPIPYHPLELE